MLSDVRYAVRSLRKTPGFTVVVVLTLALGIGANTAIFSLFHQLLLRSLPVSHPEQLVNLSAPGPKPGPTFANFAGGSDDVFSYPMFRDLEQVQSAFTGMAAYVDFKANLAYRKRVTNETGLFVSGSYFGVLRLQPALGRLLSPADDGKSAGAPVAVLSYLYWQARFGGNPAILNDTILVNGQSLTIVGVAPRDFEGTTLGVRPQLFVPITMLERVERGGFRKLDQRANYWLNVFARLKPGISIERARALINVPYRRILNEIEAPLGFGLSEQDMVRFRAKEIMLAAGSNGRSTVRDRMGTPFILLLSVAGLVLLIACANIANLLLARGAARRSEIALRLSLGASARSVVAQWLAESFLLAVCGGILGVVFAHATLQLITYFLPGSFAATLSMTIDSAALWFAAALTLGTVFLFGLLPAWQTTRVDLLPLLKGHVISSAHGRSAHVVSSLITSQTVIAMLLLVSAGLLIRSLSNVAHVALGFNTDSLVTFQVSPGLNGYSLEQSGKLFERLEDELAQLPGVTGATAAFVPLVSGSNFCTSISARGFTEVGPGRPPTQACFNTIGDGYFRTLGVPVIAGREFVRGDAVGTGDVAIVSQHLVKELELGAEPLGQWVWVPGMRINELIKAQIVGVVPDIKYSEVKKVPPAQDFMPYRQNMVQGSLNFYLRSRMAPKQILLMAEQVVARLDPNLPIEEPKTLVQQIDDNVFMDRLMSVLCAAFAMLATLLAAIGLYGMLAYSVTQRTREIGVRMALGAQRRGVAWLVMGRALRFAMVGVIAGGVLALGLAHLMRHLLFGVEPTDPLALMGAAVFLVIVAGIAAWLPARRASQVDPMIALRTE